MTQDKTHASIGGFEVQVPQCGIELNVPAMHEKLDDNHLQSESQGRKKGDEVDGSTGLVQVESEQAELRQDKSQTPMGAFEVEVPQTGAKSKKRQTFKSPDSSNTGFKVEHSQKSVSFIENWVSMPNTGTATLVPTDLDSTHFQKNPDMNSGQTVTFVPTDLDYKHFQATLVRRPTGIPVDLDRTHFQPKQLLNSARKFGENANNYYTMSIEMATGKEQLSDTGIKASPQADSESSAKVGRETMSVKKSFDLPAELSDDRNVNKSAETATAFNVSRHRMMEKDEKQDLGSFVQNRRGTRNAGGNEPLPDKPNATQGILAPSTGQKDCLGHKSRFFMIKVDSTGKVHNTALG